MILEENKKLAKLLEIVNDTRFDLIETLTEKLDKPHCIWMSNVITRDFNLMFSKLIKEI